MKIQRQREPRRSLWTMSRGTKKRYQTNHPLIKEKSSIRVSHCTLETPSKLLLFFFSQREIRWDVELLIGKSWIFKKYHSTRTCFKRAGPECRSFALFGPDVLVEMVDHLPQPENEPNDARTVIENASRFEHSGAPRHDI